MTILYDWTENSEWIKTLIVDEEDKIIIHLSQWRKISLMTFKMFCITKNILILEYAYAYLLSTSI